MAPTYKNRFKWNTVFKNDSIQYQVVLSRLLNNLCTCTIGLVPYLGIRLLGMFSLLLSCSVNAEPLRKRGKLRRNRSNFYLQREHTQHHLLFGIQANRSAFTILPGPQVEQYPHRPPGLTSLAPQPSWPLKLDALVRSLVNLKYEPFCRDAKSKTNMDEIPFQSKLEALQELRKQGQWQLQHVVRFDMVHNQAFVKQYGMGIEVGIDIIIFSPGSVESMNSKDPEAIHYVTSQSSNRPKKTSKRRSLWRSKRQLMWKMIIDYKLRAMERCGGNTRSSRPTVRVPILSAHSLWMYPHGNLSWNQMKKTWRKKRCYKRRCTATPWTAVCQRQWCM